MSLRLLPAIVMDNDEDDDGNFTKWMSSYWGHGAEGGHSRDRKRSFRRPSKTQADRRASLPTVVRNPALRNANTHDIFKMYLHSRKIL
uniref:Leukemia NUP98 fusion partner 1 n=1 Tax=Sphaeramia orbicularis TaxID=375764 RepID=A0A673B7M2_9TELE